MNTQGKANGSTDKADWSLAGELLKKVLGVFKGIASLAGQLVEVFAECVAACESETGESPERCVTIVKAELIAKAIKAGYAESTARSRVSEAAAGYKDNSGIERSKTRGRKADTISIQSYRMMLAALESESGRGANVPDKALTGLSKLASQLKREEITVKAIRAMVRQAKPDETETEPKPVNRLAATVQS